VTLSPIASRHDGFLLDLDGCLWVGDEPVEGSVEAVEALREAGKRLIFLTNDPRHAVEDHIRKLWRLGFRASAEEVLTVGSAIQHLLAARGGGSAFVVGSRALVEHVAVAGMKIVNRTELAERADVVVVSAHDAFVYDELRVAVQAVSRGAQLIGATRDATFPMPDGPWPGSGSVLAAVEAAVGRDADVVVGKPEPPMYAAALDRLATKKVLAVGDRPEIDVAGALGAGLTAALVLSGGARRADAPEGVRVAETLAELVLPGR
jgi:HAD superfamily hydrolase (TIGR01450 family)